jgi:prepilin-type N-terminal cleavage/methylation domain-containing protein
MTSHVHPTRRPLPQTPGAPALITSAFIAGRPRRGFTLLELLVVLAVSAVVASITVPRYASATARYRANFAAKRVAADLELAAATARNASSQRTVTFQTNGTYTIDSTTDLNRRSNTYRVRLDLEPYNATGLKAAFGPDAVVVFDGYGTPDTDGAVWVQVGSVERKVSMDSTGKASVE